jgi:hypothetical protein
MVSAARRLGEVPTLAERVELLEHRLAEALARIEVLESARDADDQADGAAPAPLPVNWQPLKKAAAIAGYSWSGLRKKIGTRPDGPWWKRRGSWILVDVTAMPRRRCDLTP